MPGILANGLRGDPDGCLPLDRIPCRFRMCLIKSPPVSLVSWYKPDNKRQVWLQYLGHLHVLSDDVALMRRVEPPAGSTFVVRSTSSINCRLIQSALIQDSGIRDFQGAGQGLCRVS